MKLVCPIELADVHRYKPLLQDGIITAPLQVYLHSLPRDPHADTKKKCHAIAILQQFRESLGICLR